MKKIFFLFLAIVFSFTSYSQNYEWAKNVGSMSDDWGYGIAVDNTGNVYVTGNFRDTADFDPGVGIQNLISSGSQDLFFAKYDSSGNYIWAKKVGGKHDDTGKEIIIDSAGNVYITGSFHDTVDFDPGPGNQFRISKGSGDIFFAKYDPNGNYIWAKNVGGTSDDRSFRIAVDASDNVYVTGNFKDTADFDPGVGIQSLASIGDYDLFFAKYNPLGNYIWAKSIGGIDYDYGYSLAVDIFSNVFLTGYFNDVADFDPGPGTQILSSAGSTDIFFAKYDSSGNYIWANRIGGTSGENSNSIKVSSSGNVYITGSFSSIVDFDPGAGVQNLSPSGGVIFIASYDSNGNYIWAKNVGGTFGDTRSLALDALSNIYITGSFGGTADFDPGAGTQNLISNGGWAYDVFFARYDSNGNYLLAGNVDGPGFDYGQSITADNSGNIYITGIFHDIADFDPGPGTQNLIAAGGAVDIYIAKYGSSVSPVLEKNVEDHLKFYPNPVTDGKTFIQIDAKQSADLKLEIMNGMGQVLQSESRRLNSGKNIIELDVKSLAAGTYFVKLMEGEQTFFRKILINE